MVDRRSTIASHLRDALRVYVLTDRSVSRSRAETDVVREAIAGGATAIQLRWKDGPLWEAVEIGRRLRDICDGENVLFVVNDRVDLALALDADGVHVGEDDLPVREVRKLVGSRMIVGYSPPTLVEAVQAERAGADYLGVGPVFGTSTKADAGRAVGTDRIRDVAASVRIPVVGIGGIGSENAGAVIAAGAAGVAVISAVVAQDDIAAASRTLRQAVDAALDEASGTT
jgi:thiamine-phosphate pyrophosphorylase